MSHRYALTLRIINTLSLNEQERKVRKMTTKDTLNIITADNTEYENMKNLAILDGYASSGMEFTGIPFTDTVDIDSRLATATPTEIYMYWYDLTMDYIEDMNAEH